MNLKEALMFLAIVLSGVLPIMISMKQRAFYILTVYPFFAIGFAYYLYPILKPAVEKINRKTMGFKIFKGITIVIIITSISLSVLQVNRVGRDRSMLHDSKAVIDVVGKNATINICPNMFSIWSLHGYFSRYGNVSLEANQKNVCQYYLSLDDCHRIYLSEEHYELIPVKLKAYKLYRKKDKGAE